MSYIFLDESGDLGFDFKKKNASKFFVITFLFVPDSKLPIEKIVKKTHGELQKKLKRKIGILHATNEKSLTRKRLLKRLAEKDCRLMFIYLNKAKVFTKLQEEKSVLYNYVTNILLDRICSKKIIKADQSIELVASRRETNRFLNENFKSYLTKKVRENHKIPITISIKSPHEEKCLQATDFASWAFFRKQEKGDASFYSIIKKLIVEENPLFG